MGRCWYVLAFDERLTTQRDSYEWTSPPTPSKDVVHGNLLSTWADKTLVRLALIMKLYENHVENGGQ
jgi:hypothetical protein